MTIVTIAPAAITGTATMIWTIRAAATVTATKPNTSTRRQTHRHIATVGAS